MKAKTSPPPNKQLSSALKELETALNKWEEITVDEKASPASPEEPKAAKPNRDSDRNSELILETRLLLSRLKSQLADLT